MAETAVEFDTALLYGVENGFLADQSSSSFSCGSGGGRVGITNDGDTQVGFYGMWEADTVTDHGTVLERFEAKV